MKLVLSFFNRLQSASAALAIVTVLIAGAGCTAKPSDLSSLISGGTTLPSTSSLYAIQGNGASLQASSTQVLSARALQSDGTPVAGVAINFQIASGSGTLSALSAITDGTGTAQVTFTAPASPGQSVVLATSGSGNATFALTTSAAVAATSQLITVQGNGVTLLAGASQTLSVKALSSSGTSVQGVIVSFSIVSGSGTLSASNATTDVNGLAAINFTAPATNQQVVVLATSVAGNATFQLTCGNTVNGTQLLALTGNNSTVQVNGTQSIRARALTSAGVAITGITVNYSVISGGGTLSAASAATDVNGDAIVTYTAGASASQVILLATSSAGNSSFNITVANGTGQGSQLLAVAGNAVSIATSGTQLLKALAVDSSGTAMSGVTVHFTVMTGSGTLSAATATTDVSGGASVTYTAPVSTGNVVVAATSSAGSTTFAINVGGAPAGSTLVSLDGNNASVIASGTQILRARALTPGGVGVAGIVVNFSIITTGGSLSAATATTAMNGDAVVTLTAPATSGQVIVLATSAAGNATFSMNVSTQVSQGSQLLATQGNNTSVLVNATQSIQVKAVDGSGTGIQSVTVKFSITSGSGSLSAATATTDVNGLANVTYTAPATAGNTSIIATSNAGSVAFTLTVGNSAAGNQVLAIQGNGSSILTSGTQLLTVIARTGSGAALPNTLINFSVVSGTGTLSAVSSTTDASGLASVTFTAPATAGNSAILASSVAGSVVFNVNYSVLPAGSRLLATQGNGATLTINSTQSLQAKAVDGLGNPLQNVAVTFTIASGSGSLTSLSGATDINGLASITYTAPASSGSAVILATSPAGTVSYSLLINTTSSGNQLIALTGNNTSVRTNGTQTLKARALSSAGTALTGVTVNFSVITGGGTVTASATTDSNGDAAATYTASGTAAPVIVLATSIAGSAPFSFNVTTQASPGSQLLAIQGNGVSIVTSATQTIQVKAVDVNGLGLSNIVVSFNVASGLGSVGSANATTDSNGLANVTYTAGASSGNVVILASSNAGSVTFNLTIGSVATGNQLLATQGNNVSILASSTQALQVKAVDSTGTAISGTTVSFAIASGGGSLSATSGSTDGSGFASVTLTAPSSVSNVVVLATSSAGSVAFSVSVQRTVGTNQLLAIQGNGVSVVTSTTQIVQVKAIDGSGIALPNVNVTFSLVSGSGSVSNTSAVTTDSNGLANVTYNAPATVGNAVILASSTIGSTTFSITVGGAPPGSQLLALDGAGAVVATAGTQTIRVKAISGTGTALSGIVTNFSVIAGNGTVGSGGTATTDVNGYASLTYTAGASAAQTIILATSNAGNTTFALTVGVSTSTNNQLVAISGNNSTVASNNTRTLTVRALSGNGTVIQGVTVAFAIVSGGSGSTLSSATAVTSSTGDATVTFTAGSTLGAATILATSNAGNVSLNLTVGAAGTGASIVKVSGDGSTVATSTALTTPIKLLVLDANNSPITGTGVTFSILSGGGTLASNLTTDTKNTDANGFAQTTYTSGTTAGTVTILATVVSVGSATFNVFVSSGSGGGGGASLSFNPTTYSPASGTWLNVNVGSSGSKTVSVTNSSGGNIYITSIAASSPFSVTSDTCARQPNATATTGACSVTLGYAPTDGSTSDKFLYVIWSGSSDGSNSQVSTLPLEGSGPAPLNTFAGLASISNVSVTSMQLNWASITGNIGYRIYDMSSGTAVLKATTAANASTYLSSGLTASTSYTYRVRALNSGNVEDTNTVSLSATTNAAALLPTLTTISNYTLASGSNSNAVRAGQTVTVDVNNIANGSPGNDTGMTYACYVGNTVTGACDYTGGGATKTACSNSTLPNIGGYSFGTGTGILSWTPSYAAEATYEFCINGINSNGSANSIFQMNVINPTFGMGVGDSGTNLLADWRAAFSNYNIVATGSSWADLFSSWVGTITGTTSWTGTNANTLGNSLALNFNGTTNADFGTVLNNKSEFMWDAWINNTSTSFTSSNNKTVVLSKGSLTSGIGSGFSVKQNVDPYTSATQMKFRFDQNYANIVEADGATIYYRMDDAAGTTLTDQICHTGYTTAGGASSINSNVTCASQGVNDGTLVQADYTFQQSGTLPHEATNYSLQHTAANTEWSVFPVNNAFKPATTFSFEFWMKAAPGTFPNNVSAMSYNTTNLSDGWSVFFINSTQQLAWEDRYNSGACGIGYFYAPGPISYPAFNEDAQWHHYVVTYGVVAGTNQRNLYMDGNLASTSSCGTGGGMTWAATPTNRGFNNQAGINFDELAWYSGVTLSAAQVKNHYMAAAGAVPQVAQFPANAQMQDGPVGYWRLGENPSATTVAVDSSGYQNHGQYYGSPTSQTGVYQRSGIAGSAQAPGSALDSDGSMMFPTNTATPTDYVKIPGSTSLEFNQNLTVETWVNFTGYGGNYNHTIVAQDNVWSLIWGQYGNFRLYIGGASVGATGNNTIPWYNYTAAPLGWYHLAVVYDGTNNATNSNRFTLYINGVGFPATSSVTSLSSYFASVVPIRIGADLNAANYQTGSSMYVDEVAVYNKSLTAQQINTHVQDGSYRYCVAPATTTYTNPSNSSPYDHLAALFNGTTATIYANGQRQCAINTGTSVNMSTDTNHFTLGNTSTGFAGNITSARVYGENSGAVPGNTNVLNNFAVTADKFRPQPVGVITQTGLIGQYEAGASKDGVRPNDYTIGCGTTSTSYWRDLSSSFNNGVLNNFTTCGTYGWKPTSGTSPIYLNFLGSSNMYVDLGPNTTLAGTSAMSVCTWMKSSSIPVSTAIVSKDSASHAFFLGGDNSTANKVQFNIGGVANKVTSTTSLNDSTWHYVCGTYDGTNERIYVDGTYQAKTAYSTAIATTTDELAIGASVSQLRAAAANGFTGNIGAVHFYNIGLSSTQIYKNCLAQEANYGSSACALYGTDFP